MSTTPKDLFRLYAIPPSSLHEAVQKLARQEGWMPPWDREEQQKVQQSQKKAAGKSSGLMRKGRVKLRRLYVKIAFERLQPAYQMQPFSVTSLDALEAAYRTLLAEGNQDPDLLMSAAPFKAGRETIINDLKQLGVKSRRRTQRSG